MMEEAFPLLYFLLYLLQVLPIFIIGFPQVMFKSTVDV